MPARKKKVSKKKKVSTRRVATGLPTTPSIHAQGFSDYLMLFYGPPGVGKTTFVNSLPGQVLFLSTDRGTRSMEAMRTEVSSWQSLGQVLTQLERVAQNNQPFPYDVICIDHVTDVMEWAEDSVLVKLGLDALGDADWGKGWKLYRKAITALLHRLTALPCGVVFIAHETQRDLEVRGLKTTRTQPQMGKTAWDILIPMLDVVGYIGFRRIKVRGRGGEKKKDIRALETEPREALYCKDRTRRARPDQGYDYLPADLTGGQRFAETFS